MTTASTLAVVSNANSTGFQAWVQEIYTNLVTNCGLVQMSASMDSGQMAVPCATALPGAGSTSAGYYMFLFNDPLAKGPINPVALLAKTAGTGYNGGSSGTFTGVAMSGGTGSGALATVVLGASGVVNSITITTSGTGYLVGDQLTVTSANMVSAGAAAGGGSSSNGFVGSLTSAAAPVVLKVEFGTGAATAQPQIWITMGTSWASNGTLGALTNGALTTRVTTACGSATLASTAQPYTSRYCYNNTYGFLGMAFKQGATSSSFNVTTTASAYAGFFVFRTTDNSGNPTANAACLVTVSSTTANASATAGNGYMQCMSYTANAIYPTLSLAASNAFSAGTVYNATNNSVFNLTTTLENGVVFIIPIYTMDPGLRFNAFNGGVFYTDVPLGATFSASIIGATTLTFLNWGLPFGNTLYSSQANQFMWAGLWQ